MFKIDLIPFPYKILIGLALLAGVYCLAHWQGYNLADRDWQLKDKTRIAAEDKAAKDALTLKLKEERANASRVAAQDAAYQQQEVNHAQEIERLRRDLRSSTVRLYAKSAKPAAIGGLPSGNASDVDAQARCELDPTTADDLISITSDGDAAIRQLTALQDYVSTIYLQEDK